MLMAGRWEGAYIAHILTYNAIMYAMYAIRPNIAGGVGVAARRYNYSTQPQERMLLLRRKRLSIETSVVDPQRIRILLFTSMRIRIRIQEVKPMRIHWEGQKTKCP
jgi:hypothetical protein